jgi:dihydrofolate reductase
MGKLVWMMGTSLDGYIEGPGREIGWHQVDEELHSHMNDYLAGMAAFLSGRVTWELMADYWPTADQDPDSPEPIRQFAEIWRSAPKVVYSRSLPAGPAEHRSTVVREIVPAEVEALKETGDLALGGADVANVFLEAGLVDAVRVYVHPVLAGAGKPLFAPRSFDPEVLTLRETRTFDNGVVLLHYDVRATRGSDTASDLP